MTRVSKEELKKNDLLELISLIIYFFKNNLKVVLITAVSILFILIVIISIIATNFKNNKISAEILSQALNTYHSERNSDSERKKIIDAGILFKKIVEKYRNTQSAPIAYYYLGNLSYKLEDYTQSLNYYQSFIDKYPSHKLTNYIREGMAYVYESQKNFDSAITIYEEMISKNSDSIDIERLKLNLGRLYELRNQLDKAKAVYSQLTNNEEAKFRLSNLKEK